MSSTYGGGSATQDRELGDVYVNLSCYCKDTATDWAYDPHGGMVSEGNMARCESRSNRASHTRDPVGFSPPAPTRPSSNAGGRRISVVVVDGGHAARNGAASGLIGPPIHVVGCAAPGSEAMALVERVRPDVVLVQTDAARPIGPEMIEALKAKHPLTRIVVVDETSEGESPGSGRAGPESNGVVVSDECFVHVVASIQRAAADAQGSMATNGGTALNHYGGGPALTRREHEILRLVALGNTNNEIAQRLGLAANTVKTYWQRALHKLSARNRAEAIARAHDLHLI
jgi:two-component system, NarL family, nitrate/nitrite response regulator NarL